MPQKQVAATPTQAAATGVYVFKVFGFFDGTKPKLHLDYDWAGFLQLFVTWGIYRVCIVPKDSSEHEYMIFFMTMINSAFSLDQPSRKFSDKNLHEQWLIEVERACATCMGFKITESPDDKVLDELNRKKKQISDEHLIFRQSQSSSERSVFQKDGCWSFYNPLSFERFKNATVMTVISASELSVKVTSKPSSLAAGIAKTFKTNLKVTNADLVASIPKVREENFPKLQVPENPDDLHKDFRRSFARDLLNLEKLMELHPESKDEFEKTWAYTKGLSTALDTFKQKRMGQFVSDVGEFNSVEYTSLIQLCNQHSEHTKLLFSIWGNSLIAEPEQREITGGIVYELQSQLTFSASAVNSCMKIYESQREHDAYIAKSAHDHKLEMEKLQVVTKFIGDAIHSQGTRTVLSPEPPKLSADQLLDACKTVVAHMQTMIASLTPAGQKEGPTSPDAPPPAKRQKPSE